MNTKTINEDNSTKKNEIASVCPDEINHWVDCPQQPVIIEFYASWCIYHLLTKRKLERLKDHLGDNVLAGCIDCTGIEDLVHSVGVHQIPTIGYFHGGTRILWQGDTDLEIMIEQIDKTKPEAEPS